MAKEKTKIEWKKGDFAISRGGFLCRLDKDPVEGMLSIELVANYEKGVGITCGGYSMGGTVAELSPLATTEHFILARAYEAMTARDAAKAEVHRQDEIFKTHAAALKALKDAERASAAAIAKADLR
jgi:hypothetical protein